MQTFTIFFLKAQNVTELGCLEKCDRGNAGVQLPPMGAKIHRRELLLSQMKLQSEEEREREREAEA